VDWGFGIGAHFAFHRRLFFAWGFKHSDEGGGHVFGFGDVADVCDYLQPPINHNCFRLDQCNFDS
jgi:hypothetical protein